MMLFSHLNVGLPLYVMVKGFHLNIFLAALASSILCTEWPRSHRTPKQYAPQIQYKFTGHSAARSTV